MNDQLAASGEALDPKTRSGSVYLFQDEDNPPEVKGWNEKSGMPKGTTTDLLKVTFINGDPVSADPVDLTASDRAVPDYDQAEETINNKMKQKTPVPGSPGKFSGKSQSPYVVWVAKSDEEANELARRFASNPNVRVVNPATGFDTGELHSPTEVKARAGAGMQEKAPSRAGGGAEPEGGTGRVAGALDALNVIGDIYLLWSVGVAIATGNIHGLQCSLVGYDPAGPCNPPVIVA